MSEQTFANPKDARAQAKAEKAYRKASRPLWKKKRLWVGLALLGLLLLIVLAAALSGGAASTSDAKSASGTSTIVLEIGGTATEAGNVTYTDGGVQTSQETNIALPWRKEIPVNEDMLISYQVMAQNAGDGDITCKITGADGEVLTENTSSGEFAIVTCNS